MRFETRSIVEPLEAVRTNTVGVAVWPRRPAGPGSGGSSRTLDHGRGRRR
jgi:hypothetical protein